MRERFRRLWRVLSAVVVVFSLMTFQIAVAGAPEVGPAPPLANALDAASPTGADDGTLDVGAEAQGDAPPAGAGGSDLPAANGAAWNFYTQMRNAGYTGAHNFYWTDWNSWEIDFKRAALGGIEDSMIDNVDIGYYHDHGNGGVGEWFPWDHTDNWLTPNDCLGAYGTKDLEWLAIGGCSTFSDALRQGWGSCLNGAHLLLGYKTTAYDANWGGIWADQMLGWQWLGIWWRAPKTVTQAWFTQCDQTQPSSVAARVIAEDWRHFNDKVWNRGGPAYGDFVDSTYFWQDHNCYKPPAKQVNADALSAAAVQTYVVDPRNVNEDYAQGIANSLGLQGTAQCPPDSAECGLVASQGGQTLTLSIETASGGFVLQNTSQLWAGQDPSQPLALPGPEAAIQLAGSYLDGHQALPGSSNVDMATAHYETDSQTEAAKPANAAMAAAPERILQTQGTDVMVAYGRTLPTGVRAADGAMIAASTVGPGSVTKLYYGGASTALRGPGQEQLPIGLVGGTRDVHEGAAIPTQTYNATWEAFLADHQLAVIPIPLDWNTAELKNQTFSYYEQPQNVPQQELIPVWVFTADLYKGTDKVGPNTTIYVPASTDYYPPDVTIVSPARFSIIPIGKEVDLMSTAAGGYGPFAFEWSTNKQGVVGNPAQNTTFVLDETPKPGQAATPTTISLKVTNQNGQYRTVSVVVNPLRTWLPLITK